MAQTGRFRTRLHFRYAAASVACLCLALAGPAAIAAAETVPRDEFLGEVRALLEARGQDPVFGWAPGTVDGIIELLGVRLDHAHIVPTTQQLEDLRTSFRKPGAPQPIPMWDHLTTRRWRTAQIVYRIEEFLTSGPADPEQQEAARKQATDLIAKWTDDLAAREPEAADDIRKWGGRALDIVRAGRGDPASAAYARPAPPAVIEECEELWQRLLEERVRGESGSPASLMLQALSPLSRATRRPPKVKMDECEDYAPYLEWERTIEVLTWESQARERAMRYRAFRSTLGLAMDSVPVAHDRDWGNCFSIGAQVVMEPFEKALLQWDVEAMRALLQGAPGLEEPYEVLWAQSRLARALYAESLSPEVAIESRRALAGQCVRTAAAAFEAAPDPFERACVAAESLPLAEDLREDGGETEFLLDGALGAPGSAEDEAGIRSNPAGMAVRLALAEAEAPEIGPPDVDAERPRLIGTIFGEELQGIDRLVLPWNVAVKVWGDAPDFVRAWLPADAVERAEELRPSIRWHLWVAVTQRLPTPDERILIGRQVEELADLVGRTIEAASTDPGDDRQIAATYRERMLASYRRTADNCLFPYWKRALRPRELADLTARIQKTGAQANEAGAPLADEDLDRLYERLLGLVVEHGAPGVLRLMPNGDRPSFTGRLGNAGDYCFYIFVGEGSTG